ncbi:MarR family transcriptional regulator [Maribrevibacterium harenarium]|uniref:MarR family transcriptional regulator n=1 Tax=Maribrevibacterium harenarium TaxID=2589817 RepID=A0A501WL62_9GAMM|nr:MarR family transcriptional regulator [Maribrevibacterium harenarium]TPE48884.1 MarR family transcriptional regulator [Maribrevibacterium harenarium]
MADHVAHLLAQWQQQRPELDCTPMAVIARIGRANRFLEPPVLKVIKDFTLSRIEFDILATLRRANKALTPTQLYKETLLSSGTMSTKLEGLVERGLVERLSHNQDRRSCLVQLTQTGVDLINEALEAHLDNEARLLQSLSKDEQLLLAKLLGKLLVDLEKDNDTK